MTEMPVETPEGPGLLKLEEPVGRFQVSVKDVSQIAPNVAIKHGAADTRGRPWRDGAVYIGADHVRGWIRDVESRVVARLPILALIREGSRLHEVVRGAGHDIVVNGAGSYTYAAAGPEKAGLNDTTSYAEVLWRRYLDGIEQLEKTVEWWRGEHPEDVDVATPTGLPGSGRFPKPAIPDCLEW